MSDQSRNPRPKSTMPHAKVITAAIRQFLRTLALVRIFNVKVVNGKVIPKGEPAIIVSNHPSLSDAFFILSAVNRNDQAAFGKDELRKNPILRLYFWLMGYIPVKRGDLESGRLALKRAELILRHNGVVINFAEGKCSPENGLHPFKIGPSKLAKATGVKIYPVGIKGGSRFHPLGSKLIRFWRPVQIAFGNPIDPSEWSDLDSMNEALVASVRKLAGLPPQS